MRGHAFSCVDETGGALIAVIALTITITVVVAGVLTLEVAEQRLFRREALRLQARYEAEACLADALEQMSNGRALPFSILSQQPAHEGLPVRRRAGRVVPFGLFALVDCSGFTAREGHRLLSLAGEALTAPYEAALVVADPAGGLVVADTATVEGALLVGAGG